MWNLAFCLAADNHSVRYRSPEPHRVTKLFGISQLLLDLAKEALVLMLWTSSVDQTKSKSLQHYSRLCQRARPQLPVPRAMRICRRQSTRPVLPIHEPHLTLRLKTVHPSRTSQPPSTRLSWSRSCLSMMVGTQGGLTRPSMVMPQMEQQTNMNRRRTI
jgi:hypothetical protein